MEKGTVSVAEEFIFGGYQDQCVGFVIFVEIDDKIGGTFFHISEAFYTNTIQVEKVREELKKVCTYYNISKISNLIGKQVFYKYNESNGKFSLIY